MTANREPSESGRSFFELGGAGCRGWLWDGGWCLDRDGALNGEAAGRGVSVEPGGKTHGRGGGENYRPFS